MRDEPTLIVRMGAMGDVIHALPAAAAFANVTWMVKPQWAILLSAHPAVRRVVSRVQELRFREFRRAYDLQGLIKSAAVARWASRDVTGFSDPREWPARWLYTAALTRCGTHVVDQYRSLTGSQSLEFPLPEGKPSAALPERFVLASPLAGWRSKQWPMEHYRALAKRIPIPLILNGPPGSGFDHESDLAGLIDATRRATAVVGVDSGPLHLAAALRKQGVAIFGPTDPARNGPYGGSIRVLREPGAATSYKRLEEISPSMRAITPQQVAEALEPIL